jgi:hypothetical protein
MVCIGRAALVANVWVTAAMTLVAGVPHFDCRCPDGSVKPFGLGALSRLAGCCCARTNSKPHPARPAARPAPSCRACCCHQAPPAADEPESDTGWQRPGCTKLLVRPTSYTPGAAQVLDREPPAAEPMCLAGAVDRPTPTAAEIRRADQWPRALPPPGDRLSLLQRLTI